MPDNYLDDKYIDKAWEQMQQMLDQEMPVEHKRRRIAFWWWLFPLALGSTIAMVWWFSRQNMDTPTMVEQQSIQPPVASADAATPKLTPSNKANEEREIAEINVNSALANKKSSVNSFSSEREPVLSELSNSAATSKKATVDTNKEQIADHIIIDTKQQNQTFATATQETKPNSIESALENALESQNAQSQKPIDPFLLTNLAQLNPKALPIDEATLSWSPETLRKHANWRWGAMAALHTGEISVVDGYDLGLFVDMPLRGRKFYLRSGLNIGEQKLMLAPQKRNANTSADFANDPNQSPTSNGAQADASAIISNFNIQASQLTMPITFVYQPRPKWGIEGGASLSYLINAIQLTSDEAILESNSTGGSVGFSRDTSVVNRYVNSLASSAGQNLNLTELNRWELAAAAGLAYYPADRWGIRLQYRFGITDFLKNDNFQSYNRNVRLSVLYYFR